MHTAAKLGPQDGASAGSLPSQRHRGASWCEEPLSASFSPVALAPGAGMPPFPFLGEPVSSLEGLLLSSRPGPHATAPPTPDFLDGGRSGRELEDLDYRN